MIRYERHEVSITERRLTGTTIAEALERLRREQARATTTKRFGLFPQKVVVPATPIPPTPDLRFDSFPHLSLDKDHVIAIAEADGQLYLVRDDQILLQQEALAMRIEDNSQDFSRMLVTVQSNGSHSLYCIQETEVAKIVEGADYIHPLAAYTSLEGPGKIYLFAKEKEGQTTFLFFGKGNKDWAEDKSFTVGTLLKPDQVAVESLLANLTLIWHYPGQEPQTSSLYRDDQLLADSVVRFKFSSDHSHFLAITANQDTSQIVKDGQVLFVLAQGEKTEGLWAGNDLSLIFATTCQESPDGQTRYNVYYYFGNENQGTISDLEAVDPPVLEGNTIIFKAQRGDHLYLYTIQPKAESDE